MPLYTSKVTKDIKAASLTHSDLSKAQGDVDQQVTQYRNRRDEAKQRLKDAYSTHSLVRQQQGTLTHAQESMTATLQEVEEESRKLQIELDAVDAYTRVERTEQAACHEQIRHLKESQAALTLVCETLPISPRAEKPVDAVGLPLPLSGVAGEATAIIKHMQEGFERQLAATTAKTADVSKERARFEEEYSSVKQQLEELKEEHRKALEQEEVLKTQLGVVLSQVEQMQAQVSPKKKTNFLANIDQERLRERNSKMSDDYGSQRQALEDIRGMTWQELGTARNRLTGTTKTMLVAVAEHEQQQKELLCVAAAHSRPIAKSSVDRVKLPRPDAGEVSASILQAQAATRRFGERDQNSALRGPVGDSGTNTPREDAGAGTQVRTSPSPVMSPSPVPASKDRALILEQDGSKAWGPDIGPGQGPVARPRPTRPSGVTPVPLPTFKILPGIPPRPETVTGAAPVSARQESGYGGAVMIVETMQHGVSPLTAAPVPHAAGPAVRMNTPRSFSARTPRTDIRNTGQLVVGQVN